MTDRERTDDELDSGRRGDGDEKGASSRGKDIMQGRSFAGTNWANTERGQTRERQRIADNGGENLDESGEMVTDAEIEAREERHAEGNED